MNFAPLTQSLTDLGLEEGVDYDRYMKQAVGTQSPNGIGSSGGHGANSIQLARYSTILFFSGRSSFNVLDDGAVRKSDDLGVLEAWHAIPGARNIAYFGDHIAEFLARPQSPAGIAYLTQTIGVSYEGRDVVPYIGGQLAPIVRPAHAAFSSEYLTYFNCQVDPEAGNTRSLFTHDYVTPGPGAFYGHQYVDATSGQPFTGPAASVVFPNPRAGVTGYDILFPYSIQWIQQQSQRSPVGLSDRTLLISELFDLFNTTYDFGSSVSAPARATLALTVTPNPFNPRTTIHFDIAVGQHGRVNVFNLRGELVKVLHDGEYQLQEFLWDGTDRQGRAVASGVYIVRASADGQSRFAKIALVR